MQDAELWDTVRKLAGQTEILTVVDVGAYLGTTSGWFIRTFPDAQVYAFEPDPRSYEKLCANLATASRAHPSPVALSRERGEAAFHLGTKGFTSSLYPREKSRRRYFRRDFTMVDRAPVQTDTLDNIFAGRSIDILKLDTQGSELDILVGATDLLEKGAISILVTEFFFIQHYDSVPLLDSLWSHLRGFGYEIYDLFKGPHASNGQIRYGDAIFVSPSFRQTILDAARDEE